MQNIEEITLSPVEATAYWWVTVIKHKVRELAVDGLTTAMNVIF